MEGFTVARAAFAWVELRMDCQLLLVAAVAESRSKFPCAFLFG